MNRSKELLRLGLSLSALLIMATTAMAQSFTVHEWGTFTTLHGATGGTLSGLYFEEEALPSFVYHFPGFSPDSGVALTSCKGVTVKMETPVLYFYSPVEQKVHVRVDFPRGAISQWYPDRSAGETPPVGDTIDFYKPERSSSIEWNATVLDTNTKEHLTQTGNNVTAKWNAPRATTSNLVKNEKGEVEKYLFYRGLANFSMPIIANFIDQKTFLLANTSSDTIPFIYVYQHTDQSSSAIWATGPLAPGESRRLTTPVNFSAGTDMNSPEYHMFDSALASAGLTKSEASAMLQTWQDGYFQTVGFKVFWIVPRKLTDQILPITITPTPASLERVLVGKTEVLTPAFEKQLLAYYKANGNLDLWKTDRYHLAYMERVNQLLSAESVSDASLNASALVFPNPAHTTIHLEGFVGEATLRNVLGQEISKIALANGTSFELSHIGAGLYTVSGRAATGSINLKFLKQ
jgi:hypothetical protein